MTKPNPTWLDRHTHIRRYIKWGLLWVMGVATFLLIYFTLGDMIILKLTEALAEWQGIELDLTSGIPSTKETKP